MGQTLVSVHVSAVIQYEAYHIADTDRPIRFPYGPNENGEMNLLVADTLENQYPLTWEYPEKNRDVWVDRAHLT